MKITFILHIIGIGGGIRSTFELANRLQDRGHNVSVVYPVIPMRSGAKWYDFRKLVGRVVGTIGHLKHGNSISWFDLRANLIRVPTLAEMDEDTLAKNLEYLVEHPEVWGAMGRIGRVHMEQEYDVMMQVDKLENIYEGLCEVRLHAQ